LTCYTTAINELKAAGNTGVYQSVIEKAKHLLGQRFPSSLEKMDFVVNTNRHVKSQLTTMEGQLTGHRQQENSAAIKSTLEKMGDNHASIGDYDPAVGCYEEAMSIKPSLDTDWYRLASKIIKIGVNAEKFSWMTRCVGEVTKKMERKQAVPDEVRALVCSASALAMMKDSGTLNAAAKRLLAVPMAGLSSSDNLIHPKELVDYVCLIALATFERQEISELLVSQKFKRFLHYRPIWSEILNQFQSCDFAACLANLHTLMADLLMDKYMGRHVMYLSNQIRDRALITYFSCFGSLRIQHIAEVFSCEEKDMEAQLVALIRGGKIRARVDSANKVIYARQSSQRTAVFQKALAVGDKYSQDLRNVILSMSLSHHNFQIAPTRTAGQGQGQAVH
jgi:COP9 signalosome complex subunit 1